MLDIMTYLIEWLDTETFSTITEYIIKIALYELDKRITQNADTTNQNTPTNKPQN